MCHRSTKAGVFQCQELVELVSSFAKRHTLNGLVGIPNCTVMSKRYEGNDCKVQDELGDGCFTPSGKDSLSELSVSMVLGV